MKSKLNKKEKQKIIHLIEENPNWSYTQQIAEKSKLVPLINYNLNKINSKKVPKKFLEDLNRKNMQIASKNLFIFIEAKNLLKALNKEKISSVFFRGVSVAKKFSHDTLKMVGDIDLMIKKENIKRIEPILYEGGWAATLLYPKIKEERLRNGCQLPPFFKGETNLDLHWKLSNYLEIEPRGLWNDAREFNLDGVKALGLSPEKQVIYLCVHSFLSHGGEFILRDLVDINETIAFYGNKLDWNKLLETAKHWQVAAIAFHSLSLAKKLLDSPIPESTLGELKQSSNALQLFFLQTVNEKNLFSVSKSKAAFIRFFVRFFQLRGAKKRTKFLLDLLFPSDAYLIHFHAVPNKKSTLRFHRLFNPLRLLFKGFKAIIGF